MVTRSHGIVLAALLLAGCGSSQSTAPGTPQAGELPPNYTVEYDSLLQTPRNIVNRDATGGAIIGAPAPFSDAVAFQIVRRFVIRYSTVFRLRIGIDDFILAHASGLDGMNSIKIQQTYRGLPVDVMGYGTSVISDGSVGSMTGRFMPDIQVSTTPRVSSAAAGATAIAALAPTAVTQTSAPQLEITTFDLVPRLAWAASVKADSSFASWTVMVDAGTGAVLHVGANFIID